MIAADIAWMLVATALVLLMTPGVGFFYGGMVSRSNAVSTTFQSFICIGIVGLLWIVCGYSLVFTPGNGFVGGLEHFLLGNVDSQPHPVYAPTIPHSLFMLYQATFAIITPALISGAVAERIRFKAWVMIIPLWSLLVYVPVAHWVWAAGLRKWAGWISPAGWWCT